MMTIISEAVFVSMNLKNEYVRFYGVYLHNKCEDNSNVEQALPDICYVKKSEYDKVMNDLNFFNKNIAHHYRCNVIKMDNNGGLEVIHSNLIVRLEFGVRAYGLVTCITEKVPDLDTH